MTIKLIIVISFFIEIDERGKDLGPLEVGGELHGVDLVVVEELVDRGHGSNGEGNEGWEAGKEFKLKGATNRCIRKVKVEGGGVAGMVRVLKK